jgi:hypothetical protein
MISMQEFAVIYHADSTVSQDVILFHLQMRLQNCEKELLASLCLSVRPHGTTRLLLDEFSLNLISGHF